MLPLSKPALLTVLIFTVLRDWNDFLDYLERKVRGLQVTVEVGREFSGRC
jgi:ABC-type glycerol-3-phosphate transport system permease component